MAGQRWRPRGRAFDFTGTRSKVSIDLPPPEYSIRVDGSDTAKFKNEFPRKPNKKGNTEVLFIGRTLC